MPKKYLYGAAVQGIQSFIFQTNKLKEIVGASDLVEKICTSIFQDIAGVSSITSDINWIIGAAGNIKYLFENEEQARLVVREFPKEVMLKAPGITISQALVEVDTEITADHINRLEEKLKVQKNMLPNPFYMGYMAAERSRRTGLASWSGGKDYEDLPSILKKENDGSELLQKIGQQSREKLFEKEIEKFVNGSEKSWIAVIHADGNSLGKTLQKLSHSLNGKSGQEVLSRFRTFSQNLNEATCKAAELALKETFKQDIESNIIIPLRPIVIGGDDLTVIVRAKEALQFTEKFLFHFEAESHRLFHKFFGEIGFDQDRLTSCAGIAYVKSSYPFHYAVELAEKLCRKAKEESKCRNMNSPASSVAFYKVQSSFIDEIVEMINQEQTCKDGLSFFYGPYFLSQHPTIEALSANVRLVCEENAPASQLRQWLTERYADVNSANMLLDRTIKVLESKSRRKKYVEKLALKSILKDKAEKCPVYDWITIASLEKN